eukprot:gene12977-biopygen9444
MYAPHRPRRARRRRLLRHHHLIRHYHRLRRSGIVAGRRCDKFSSSWRDRFPPLCVIRMMVVEPTRAHMRTRTKLHSSGALDPVIESLLQSTIDAHPSEQRGLCETRRGA